jgi:hypothetical protein
MGTLSNEERIVLTHTMGCLTHGANAVNAVLAHLPQLDPTLRLVKPLRGHPMSCSKIRARVPELAEKVPCLCVFSPLGAVSYPTPVLHAAGPMALPALELSRLEMDRVMQDYLKVQHELTRLAERREQLFERLKQVMAQQGVEELQTSLGVVKLGEQQGELILTSQSSSTGAAGRDHLRH